MTAPLSDKAIAQAVNRAIARVPQVPGELDDNWRARVVHHASEALASGSCAGFAWGDFMVHGDKASVQAVVGMVRARALDAASHGEDEVEAAAKRMAAVDFGRDSSWSDTVEEVRNSYRRMARAALAAKAGGA